jgi:hypothetical protein
MRANRASAVDTDRGVVEAVGLPRPLLQRENLVPAQGRTVTPAVPVRVKPGAQGVLPIDGVIHARCQGAELVQERARVRALEVAGARHGTS